MNANTVVIWNPRAGSTEKHAELRRHLQQRDRTAVVETAGPDDATRIARTAAQAGAALVVAAGGDGTVRAAVNGLMQSHAQCRFAVLPLGTANDLCRSLAIPLNPLAAVHVLDAGAVAQIDVVRAETPTLSTYFVNHAAGGNSAQVAANLTDELKQRWGPFCYLRGALEVLTHLTGFETTVQFDHDPPETFSLFNIVLGNGRAAAGGLPIAARADLADGLLDVVLIRDGSPLDTATLAAQFVLSDYLASEQVVYRQARRLAIESRPPMPFTVDGDLLSDEPICFTVEPRALSVVVGPDYHSGPPD
jgi:diacylglycerol kinase (ATP)